jgi:hypothetical protein
MYFGHTQPRFRFTSSQVHEDVQELNLEEYAIFSGHAKLPTGIAIYELLKVISCALIIELKTGIVKDASFTAISSMTGSFISSLFIGWSIHDGMDILEKRFDKHCHISAKKAFLKAAEVAITKYKDYMNNQRSL